MFDSEDDLYRSRGRRGARTRRARGYVGYGADRLYQALERQIAHLNALSLQAVALLADRAETRAVARRAADQPGPARSTDTDPSSLVGRAPVEEVRQTLRLSAAAARNRVELARAITAGTLISAGQALESGRLTLAHVRVAAEHAEGRPDELVSEMLADTLARASSQTPGDFGKSLKRAEHRLDPTGAAAR